MLRLRIHDILVWIRIREPMSLTNGSGSGYYYFVIDIQDANKKLISKKNSADYFLQVHLHHFSKIKRQKEVIQQQESRFFLLFLLDDRRIRIRIHQSEVWTWIQEAQKHTVPDPNSDPQHCFLMRETYKNNVTINKYYVQAQKQKYTIPHLQQKPPLAVKNP